MFLGVEVATSRAAPIMNRILGGHSWVKSVWRGDSFQICPRWAYWTHDSGYSDLTGTVVFIGKSSSFMALDDCFKWLFRKEVFQSSQKDASGYYLEIHDDIFVALSWKLLTHKCNSRAEPRVEYHSLLGAGNAACRWPMMIFVSIMHRPASSSDM